MDKMKTGTVVLCQMEIDIPHEIPIILGTFGIVIKHYGVSCDVHFGGRTTKLTVPTTHILQLGDDNWNSVVLDQERTIRGLKKEIQELMYQLETEQSETKILQDRLSGYINRGRK